MGHVDCEIVSLEGNQHLPESLSSKLQTSVSVVEYSYSHSESSSRTLAVLPFDAEDSGTAAAAVASAGGTKGPLTAVGWELSIGAAEDSVAQAGRIHRGVRWYVGVE